jgi:hypothetical protein
MLRIGSLKFSTIFFASFLYLFVVLYGVLWEMNLFIGLTGIPMALLLILAILVDGG